MSLFKTPSNNALVIFFKKETKQKNVQKIKKYKNINKKKKKKPTLS